MATNNNNGTKLNVGIFTKVHRKVGLFFMPLLLLIVITGGLSLFRAELVHWQFPQYDVGRSHVPGIETETNNSSPRKHWQELVDIARDEYGFSHKDFHIFDNRRFGDYIVFYNKTNKIEDMLFMDAVTGKAIDSSELTFSETVYDMHMRLLLPSSWGKYLVGILGLLLTYLVFTGFLAHKNIRKNFYRLRLHKGRQIFTTDLHKLLGSWSLFFSGLMAITGALLGLFGIVLIVLALAAYGGDQQALITDFLGSHPKAAGGTADLMPLDSLYELARQQWTGFSISTMEIHNYADPAMRVTFEGELLNGFLTQQHITLNAISGETTFITDFTDKGVGGYMYSALPSLHFASFGGIWLKLIYWFLTLVLLLVMLTGMSIKSLRLRGRGFSKPDLVAVVLSETVLMASALACLFALNANWSINPANATTLSVITLVALIYSLVQRFVLKMLPDGMNSAAIMFAVVAVSGVFAHGVLVFTIFSTVALTLWLSQKVATMVEKSH
ncbi:PepSY-associated TM helix domain-containing protein [Kangiella shandongensis]|uniref:PepSY-associated TM helix domain-containing protein n=1 Tax=Kangiella shandongensis TaxID=2763258 RepID=UPI001CBF04AB|nr:PepSY-associated TM helix domain-containing protein [Kangiella shandongensis]